ncbi:MAG: DNA alkylation repair protein [Paracoccaceae bacterium]
MSPQAALAALIARSDPNKAAEAAAYHKVDRRYLGLAVPGIEALTDDWRAACTLDQRLALADALWRSDIHEARIAAAKLLTQARIRPDDAGAWALILSWVPQFDAWAIADHVCIAGQKRLIADPSRLDQVEPWTQDASMWVRRAALVMTLPWAKMNHPKPADLAIRDRVLDWAGGYVGDKDWFIQKAVAWWLRDLSRHDAPRARGFLAEHGPHMKSWARKEAVKYLDTVAPLAPLPSQM